MLLTLPLEIIYSIAQAVDNTSDLCSLAICCTLLREEAQRALFLHPITSRSQQNRFLATMIRSPRLALIVHTYSVRYRIELDRPSESGISADFAFALRAMRKLKRLAVETSSISPGDLQGCTFNLDAFIWGSPLKTQDVTSLISGFLPWQPNLRHLGLFGTIQAEGINPLFLRSLCPKLESLETLSNSVVDAFFSSRRAIRSLQWMFKSIGPTTTSPHLAQTKNYRAIVGNTITELPILRLLTSLVLLELVMSRLWTHSMLNNKITFLKDVRDLQVLILTAGSRYPLPHYDEGSPVPYFNVIENAFRACKTLRYIDVSIASPGTARKYKRFFPPRGADGPVKSAVLSTDDVLAWRKSSTRF